MVDQPETAAIRQPRRLSPALVLSLGGCFLGASIGAGGCWLADRQDTALLAREAVHLQEREQLLEALQEEKLKRSRLRLEELAELPLVSEYLELVHTGPDGNDARELKDYLQTVLQAVLEETGLARIALEGPEGKILISTADGSAVSSGAMAARLEAPVPDFSAPERPAGRLIGELASGDLEVLAVSDQGPETTAGIAAHKAAASEPSMVEGMGVARSTRLFAFIGGLAIAVLGLLAAALFRRPQADRT